MKTVKRESKFFVKLLFYLGLILFHFFYLHNLRFSKNLNFQCKLVVFFNFCYLKKNLLLHNHGFLLMHLHPKIQLI